MDHPQISVIDREFFSHSAAALATACKIQVTADAGYYEVRNNDVLGIVGHFHSTGRFSDRVLSMQAGNTPVW